MVQLVAAAMRAYLVLNDAVDKIVHSIDRLSYEWWAFEGADVQVDRPCDPPSIRNIEIALRGRNEGLYASASKIIGPTSKPSNECSPNLS
jgi:hypothetical protein